MPARQRNQNSFSAMQEGMLSNFSELFLRKTRGVFGRKK
jgi:hypothetical protein